MGIFIGTKSGTCDAREVHAPCVEANAMGIYEPSFRCSTYISLPGVSSV